jgi:hypothetical protein
LSEQSREAHGALHGPAHCESVSLDYRLDMRVGLLLLVTAVAGCQCHITPIELNPFHDAGTPIHDAGPLPPKYPLKAGDSLKMIVQGRTQDTCAGHTTPGDCQIALTAQFDITNVKLDSSTQMFTLTANATYTAADGNLINDAAIKPLILEKTVPFGTATNPQQPQSGSNVTFSTTTAMTDQLTEPDFPFFQLAPAAPQIFETAAQDFKSRFQTLDAQANISTPAAADSMEVFYKDSQAGAKVELHKLHIEYMKFGFIGAWDEEMVPFVDNTTTPRNDSAFQNSSVPDFAGNFPFPPTLTRDGVDYTCSTFSQTCSASGAPPKCLSVDPDAAPGPC